MKINGGTLWWELITISCWSESDGMKISTILDHIDSGHMALPEFQRGYVWNCDQVRGLFDSLYRRHPIGGLLVWATKSDDAVHLDQASQRMYEKPLHREKGAAGQVAVQLLTDLAARNIIDSSDVPELNFVWEMRNRVVHPDKRPITPEQIERMVDTVERVCVPWSRSNERFGSVSRKVK